MKSISAGMFWGLASVMFTLCVHIIAQAVKKTDGQTVLRLNPRLAA